jgi:hypothetical protein
MKPPSDGGIFQQYQYGHLHDTRSPPAHQHIPLDQMMNMFVVGGMNMPISTQISFVNGITAVFILSCILTVPAIIVSALRGPDSRSAIMKAES